MKVQALEKGIERVGFPYVVAGVMSFALLFAEHHLPSSVTFPFPISSQVEEQQSNILHQICYLFLGGMGLHWVLHLKKRQILAKTPFVVTFIALLMWCVLSTSWSADPLLSARRLVSLSLMLMGAVGAVAYWPRKAVVAFIALSGAANLTVGVIAEILTRHFTPWQSDYRFAGTLFWNQQGFCCFVLVMAALAASDLFPDRKVIFRLMALYGAVFLFETKSRSSLMGLLIGLAIYFFMTKSTRFKVSLLLGISLTGTLFYITGILDHIVDSISRKGEGAESLTGRLPLWDECFQFIKLHPLTGYGYEDFWTPDKIYYFAQKFFWTISAAHNGYIESMLTIGIVGMVLQTLVLLLGIWRGVMLYKRSQNPIFALAVCLCVFYLFAGSFEAILIVKLSPYSFYLFMLLASLCMSGSQEEEDSEVDHCLHVNFHLPLSKAPSRTPRFNPVPIRLSSHGKDLPS